MIPPPTSTRVEPDVSSEDDITLLRRFSRGDVRGFEELVRRHAAPVKAFARRMLRSAELSEEVFVDSFAKLAQAAGSWDDRGSVRGFLYTCARRHCLDVLRSRQMERQNEGRIIELERGWRWQPSPEAQAALGEFAEDLETAVASLPQIHREVLLLRVVHDLSGEEVAQILGLDEGQVRSQLSYARKLLKSALADHRVELAQGEA